MGLSVPFSLLPGRKLLSVLTDFFLILSRALRDRWLYIGKQTPLGSCEGALSMTRSDVVLTVAVFSRCFRLWSLQVLDPRAAESHSSASPAMAFTHS